jgi:hypothetical protein
LLDGWKKKIAMLTSFIYSYKPFVTSPTASTFVDISQRTQKPGILYWSRSNKGEGAAFFPLQELGKNEKTNDHSQRTWLGDPSRI